MLLIDRVEPEVFDADAAEAARCTKDHWKR